MESCDKENRCHQNESLEMRSANSGQETTDAGQGIRAISASESAAYTEELLGQLREMARGQKQDRLASLLEEARREAEGLTGA
jgi:hypothetical protein